MDAWFLWAMIVAVMALIIWIVRTRVKVTPFTEEKPDRADFEGVRRDVYGDPYTTAVKAWNQSKFEHEKDNVETHYMRRGLGWGVGVVGGVAVFLFIMSLFVVVGTNQVGIMTSFGKPQSAYSNGFHAKAPWEIKTEFDGTRQFLRFNGKGNNEEDLDKKEYPCIQVKLEGQATACLNGVVAWQMKAGTEAERKNAVELFKTYRSFERLTKNFVYSSSRVALGKVFSGHNPLIEEKNQSLGTLNQLALDELRREFDSELNIMSVDLAVPDYDDATDQSISNVQAQKAKTRLAAEEEATNAAKSKANKALQESLKDPAVNQANCIQAAKEIGKEPGFCMMSGGSSVIVDAGSNTPKN
jgi:regulator of protease activity HflC (stomatin/prohibitin superfamily)